MTVITEISPDPPLISSWTTTLHNDSNSTYDLPTTLTQEMDSNYTESNYTMDSNTNGTELVFMDNYTANATENYTMDFNATALVFMNSTSNETANYTMDGNATELVLMDNYTACAAKLGLPPVDDSDIKTKSQPVAKAPNEVHASCQTDVVYVSTKFCSRRHFSDQSFCTRE